MRTETYKGITFSVTLECVVEKKMLEYVLCDYINIKRLNARIHNGLDCEVPAIELAKKVLDGLESIW